MILITGGARSGKSTFAEKLVQQSSDNALYIATSLVWDEEMARRISTHQQQRPASWQTYEGYQQLDEIIYRYSEHCPVILLECITTLISNLLYDYSGDTPIEQLDFVTAEQMINLEIERIITASQQVTAEVILVTNELGLGVVPENCLARHFRDIAGRVNQTLASQAREVYFVVSGIAMKIKG